MVDALLVEESLERVLFFTEKHFSKSTRKFSTRHRPFPICLKGISNNLLFVSKDMRIIQHIKHNVCKENEKMRFLNNPTSQYYS